MGMYSGLGPSSMGHLAALGHLKGTPNRPGPLPVIAITAMGSFGPLGAGGFGGKSSLGTLDEG